MQKNVFYKIWTWPSRKVFQGIRIYDCNRVQEILFDAGNNVAFESGVITYDHNHDFWIYGEFCSMKYKAVHIKLKIIFE